MIRSEAPFAEVRVLNKDESEELVPLSANGFLQRLFTDVVKGFAAGEGPEELLQRPSSQQLTSHCESLKSGNIPCIEVVLQIRFFS